MKITRRDFIKSIAAFMAGFLWSGVRAEKPTIEQPESTSILVWNTLLTNEEIQQLAYGVSPLTVRLENLFGLPVVEVEGEQKRDDWIVLGDLSDYIQTITAPLNNPSITRLLDNVPRITSEDIQNRILEIAAKELYGVDINDCFVFEVRKGALFVSFQHAPVTLQPKRYGDTELYIDHKQINYDGKFEDMRDVIGWRWGAYQKTDKLAKG